PVMFLEPKRLYNGPFDGHHERPVTPWSKHDLGEVPEGHYTIPIGKAAIRRTGSAVTVIAYGTMVHVALAAADETGIDAQLIDLRRHEPLVLDAIELQEMMTSPYAVVLKVSLLFAFGGEIAWLEHEHCWYSLEETIVGVPGWDLPYPHALEWVYVPGAARV